MDSKNKKSTDFRQTSIMEFLDNLSAAQQREQLGNQSNIVKFSARKLNQKREKALKRVIHYSKSLNW